MKSKEEVLKVCGTCKYKERNIIPSDGKKHKNLFCGNPYCANDKSYRFKKEILFDDTCDWWGEKEE